jgi:hypothetical protein
MLLGKLTSYIWWLLLTGGNFYYLVLNLSKGNYLIATISFLGLVISVKHLLKDEE